MKKIFTLLVGAFMALSANAKEEISISGFTPWDHCTISGSTIIMEENYKGGSIPIGRDMTSFDYVWIKYSNATGSPNFGITYDEWLSNANWGPVFASSTAEMNGSGVVGIKIDKKTVMTHGNAETDGIGIGDVYGQHVQQLTIQGQGGAAQVTVEAIYFGSAEEFVADGGDVPVRPEPGGSLTLWEGSLVYNGWGVSSTVPAKYFDVAEIGDIIYCSVKDVGSDYNPIFKNINDYSDLQGIENFLKDNSHFEGAIGTEALLSFLQANGLRFQGLGFTLTKVELRVPANAAVKGILVETQKSNIRYNLAGQRVDASYKGVIIMNGKKMINK